MVYPAFAFRSTEQWKAALITLPDSIFFDLMRSALGNIRSPFNKQRLTEELCSFFQEPETQKVVFSYINQTDHKIIAAIYALNEPTSSEIETFFSCELSLQEIQDTIINLEERLIVFRIQSENTQCLSLNPVLKNILLPIAEDNSVLFPGIEVKDHAQNLPIVISDLELLSIFAFSNVNNDFFNIDLNLRKSAAAKIKSIFVNNDMDYMLKIFQSLQCLDFFKDTKDEQENLKSFAMLTHGERLSYIACGYYFRLSGLEVPPFMVKSRISFFSSFIHSFCKTLKFGAICPEPALRHIFFILYSSILRKNRFSSYYTINNDTKGFEISFEFLINVLTELSILVKMEETTPGKSYYFLNPSFGLDEKTAQKQKTPGIVFDSAFTFVLLPGLSLEQALPLLDFCEVIESGKTTRFEISKESIVRGFNKGHSDSRILDILRMLSADRLDPNIMSLISEWEKRRGEVRIFEGVTVVLSEASQFIAKTKDFKQLILHNPVPGVFLLDSKDKEQLKRTLKKAGIDIIAELTQNKKTFSQITKTAFHSLPAIKQIEIKEIKDTRLDCGGNDYKANFHKMLDNMTLSKEEYEEFNKRIESGLILSERQLEKKALRYEKLEAHLLDYAGKLSITKQALASNDILELVYQDENGKTVTIRGYVKTLEKKESDTILFLRPLSFEDSETIIRIAIGKIQVLRKIKKSIFSA